MVILILAGNEVLGRCASRRLAQDHIDGVERVARGARDDGRVQFGDLVVEHVEPVAPRFGPKYLRLGRAWRVRTGMTNHIPPTEAISPPPHSCANGTLAWALTNTVLAGSRRHQALFSLKYGIRSEVHD